MASKEFVNDLIFPLRTWVASEGLKTSRLSELGPLSQLELQRAAVLRKVTVAFAIGKLLQHLKLSSASSYSQEDLLRMCSVDNIVVRISTDPTSEEGWEVTGIDMTSPSLSLRLVSSLFDSSTFFESAGDSEHWGRDMDAVITRHSSFCCAKPDARDQAGDDSFICYSLGVLLHFVFYGECLLDASLKSTCKENFSRALSISLDRCPNDKTYDPSQLNMKCDVVEWESSRPAKSMCPSSQNQSRYFRHSMSFRNISRVLGDLLECESANDLFCRDDSIHSLDAAIYDLRLLLREPNRFLFESNHSMKTSTKMHGRSSEAKALTDAFCRVASSGQSEAFVIGGFSGSGKTRLVRSVFDSVIAANGMLVNGKFEETSRNQLSVVLSAFDDLCIPLAMSNIAERSQQIWQQLLFEFGPNFPLLVRTLPNVLKLSPSSWTAFSFDYDVNSGGEVNFFSLCDIIKRFMRVVSSSSCPVMLFLDDMQWADQVSLGLVYSVLSDASRASCMLFVGSYRDNDVSQNHIIYDFYDWLSAFHVPLSTIHLNGVTEDDTNSMVADALGMLPRMCRSISQVVFRKTKGNPFFVQTFLRSLVDKRLLTFSLREKSWTWDTDEIYAENITPNVLDLISAKMAHLPQSGQTALKVASCFGIKIHVSIVHDLSETPQYFNLLSDLNKAVKEDFMDLDADGSHYRFVHDQVREAAYDMISSDCKDQYHFDIGIALLHTCETRIDEKRNVLSTILDQINHGVPSLLFDQSQRISVAKINFHAGAEAMQCYNYVAAYIHAKSAILLLPDDSWTTHYDLCLKLHFLLSKAAFSYSKLDEAKEALNKIVKHSGSVETTLDAYDLLHSILLDRFDRDEMGQLLVTVIGVLKTLGENIPHEDVATEDIDNQVSVTAKSFEEATDEVLLQMHGNGSKNDVAIVQGYSIVVILAHIARPNLFPYFAARWAQFCLQHRVACKHVAVAYVTFAVVLCKNLSHEDVQVGQRIGKLGLKMLNGSDSSMCVLPLVYLFYYGYLGILSEPVQVCIEMHRKAHDIGLQVGNISIATLHKLFLIYEQLHSGRKLLGLKEELEREMKRTEHYCLFPVVGTKLQTYYETVLALIGEKSSDLSHQYQNSDARWQAYTYGQIISSTFLGHFERVKHLVKMMDESNCSSQGIILFHVHVCFYDGLASIILQRRRKWKNLPKNVEKLIEVVQNASVCSKWNFKNKASLLMAEKLSLCSQNRQAEVEYDLAITAAQSSKFIHEEGLACELAGAHHVRVGNIKKAVALFRQAEHCYKDWGSLQKSRQMIEKVKHIAVKQSQIS